MTNNRKGFTIIEVVLVLAIAGLIFLMVFIALPALQRSQRNTQREDDLARVLTAANSYQTNNNGKTPWSNNATDKNFVKRYIDNTCTPTSSSKYTCDESSNQFRDPDGTIYGMYFWKNMGSNTTTAELPWTFSGNGHDFDVATYAVCGDEGIAVKGSGNRQYAIMYVLEGDAITCNDNQ